MKTGIRAAVMGNPVCDWTAMHPLTAGVSDNSAPTAPISTGKRKRAPKSSSWKQHASNTTLSAASLLKARRDFFSSPEEYYDPFASPTLFFRAASSDIPATIDPLDELFIDLDIAPQQELKKRRSYRRYPPSTLNLKLPDSMFWIGEDSVLKDQGIGLAESMARSNHFYGGPSGTGEGTGWERVDVEIREGLGSWGEAELIQIGTWLGERLRSLEIR